VAATENIVSIEGDFKHITAYARTSVLVRALQSGACNPSGELRPWRATAAADSKPLPGSRTGPHPAAADSKPLPGSRTGPHPSPAAIR